MYLFDKRFVHFMWDDELKGKKCFLSDSIDVLKTGVEQMWSRMCFKVIKGEDSYPFGMYRTDGGRVSYRFAYYDPNYEVKKAFNEGKKIQVHCANGMWRDCDEPKWYDDRKYRVKPKEEKWIAYVQCNGGKCRLVFCTEDRWGYVQDRFGVKTKLFVGAQDEVKEWCNTRQKFTPIIKAWEDGKTAQFHQTGTGLWIDVYEPLWFTDIEYRVKPDCPCNDGLDSKVCVGCEHSEDGKRHPFENYHCYGCDKSSKKKYRPYKDSAEMITDFTARFKVKCPPYAEPLIWVKGKETDIKFLVFAFYKAFIKFNDDSPLMFKELFDDYTYLDGSPVGMEEKE